MCVFVCELESSETQNLNGGIYLVNITNTSIIRKERKKVRGGDVKRERELVNK